MEDAATPKRPRSSQPEARDHDIRYILDPNRPSTISQADLDFLILEVLIENKLPFQMLERPKFKKLITRLAPGRTVMTGKTARQRVQSLYKETKEKLKAEFARVEWVGTTADAWKSRGK